MEFDCYLGLPIPAELPVSVEDEGTVDIISIAPHGAVVLTISDHLDWTDGVRHQRVLQLKLNRYLAFVESGELLERYNGAGGRPVEFRIVFKFRPDREGERFIAAAKKVVESAGFVLDTELFAESYDN